MSFDLFSSMDYFFTKFSFISILVWVVSFIIILKIMYLKKLSILVFSKTLFIYFMLNNISKLLLKYKNLSLGLSSLFNFMLLSKLTGLFPYVFGWTPHMLMIFLFSITFWLMMKLSFFFLDKMSFFSHLVPQKTPLVLGMFLSIIELMSNLIRPLTLSLRLGIKMTTGHILLGLMSIIGIQFNFNFFLMIMGTFYFLFELFVMFIQAMVFTLLMSQYSEETLILKKT